MIVSGYSPSELDDIQDRWQLRFPGDLLDLLRERRSVIRVDPLDILRQQRSGILVGRSDFDWITSDPREIRRQLDWPFEGFWFDVQHNDVWWPEWGDKPANAAECHRQLKEVFATAPRLIPLFSHRYLPEEPVERGNPVFSVYQCDVVHYRADLYDYIEREERGARTKPWPRLKEIRFWSEAVRRPNGRLPNQPPSLA
jgi:hypothetical protein